MPYYSVAGSQATISSTYKTAVRVNASGATKRGKIMEFTLGAASNPNATDTYVQWDISRITATGAGADTAATPAPTDPADGAAVSVAGVNATAEASAITANSSMWNDGINQRATVRWTAAQESQALIFPALASNGLILRGQSSTFTTAVTAHTLFQE